MILHVTETICCSHHLPWHEGRCRKPHGHTYKVEIEICGNPDENGVVMDTGVIKSVIRQLDHQDLNTIIDNPTMENVALWLRCELGGGAHVRVYENEGTWVELLEKREAG